MPIQVIVGKSLEEVASAAGISAAELLHLAHQWVDEEASQVEAEAEAEYRSYVLKHLYTAEAEAQEAAEAAHAAISIEEVEDYWEEQGEWWEEAAEWRSRAQAAGYLEEKGD